MLFNSLQFAVFLPVVFALYFATPHRWRWALLFVASCVFYAAFIPSYLLILFLVILVDYGAALWIEMEQGAARKAVLAVSLVANVGILAIFKYADFAILNINQLSAFFGHGTNIGALGFILPIGLSFHTFQSMSYTIEVYRGNFKAERHLGYYAVYVLYFPQLVAGPIERPQNVLPQLHRPSVLDVTRIRSGLQLMVVGFLKKVVVADSLALLVDRVFANPTGYNSWSLYLGAVFFSFQILCDFAGYTDIARGVSRLFGIELMVNFRRPYLAASLSEFWRRWHISLSTWFRDYLYIPLGGGWVGTAKKMRNLLIVFLVSGLWHGADVTFLVWGLVHGIFVCIETLTGQTHAPKRLRWLRVLLVFHVVTFAWIFFRAADMPSAILYLQGLWNWHSVGGNLLSEAGALEGIALIAFFLAFQLAEETIAEPSEQGVWKTLDATPLLVRWTVYVAIVACFVLCGVFGRNQFIYFQF